VAQDQHPSAGLARSVRQQSMPRASRSSRETRPGLIAGPDQRPGVGAQCASLGDRLVRPDLAVGLKLVIDDKSQDRAPPWSRPIQDRLEQEQRVPTAGKANADRRARRWIQPPIEGGSNLV